MVFQTHLCRILNLCRTASKQLIGSSGSHGASYAYLALTTHFGSRDRGFGLDHIAHETSCCQCAENAHLAEFAGLLQVIEHSRQYSARTAGRSCHDHSARSILLAHGKGIREHQATATQVGLIARSLDEVSRSLASKVKRTRQHAFVVESSLHGSLHHFPHLMQVIPYLWSFTFLDIFPVAAASLFAPEQNVGHRIHVIDIRCLDSVRAFFSQSTATNTKYRPFVRTIAVGINGAIFHAIRMERQESLWFPDDLHIGCLCPQHVEYGYIGHVTFARCSQAAIQCDFKSRSFRVFVQVYFSGLARTHGVAARRTHAYSVQFFYRFHIIIVLQVIRFVLLPLQD